VRFVRAYAGSRAARLLFWVAGLLALVMASLPHPPALPGDPSDKIQHAAAFLTLGLLGAWAFPRTAAVRLLVLLSLFGVGIELIQALPFLHRDSELLDWVTDTIAAAAALAIAGWARRR
jgi:VanZ family protein